MPTENKKPIIEESLGKKYNKLTVSKFVEFRKTPKGAKTPMVECKCECGTTKVISLWDVRSGKTKSCQANHPRYEDRSEPAFNGLYNHTYKGRAKKCGIKFSITKSQFKDLTKQPCHYCGTQPSGVYTRGTGRYKSYYLYNGLDRINSRRGYTLKNVVPCCGTCNHAKHTMSYGVFIDWLNRIIGFRSKSFS